MAKPKPQEGWRYGRRRDGFSRLPPDTLDSLLTGIQDEATRHRVKHVIEEFGPRYLQQKARLAGAPTVAEQRAALLKVRRAATAWEGVLSDVDDLTWSALAGALDREDGMDADGDPRVRRYPAWIVVKQSTRSAAEVAALAERALKRLPAGDGRRADEPLRGLVLQLLRALGIVAATPESTGSDRRKRRGIDWRGGSAVAPGAEFLVAAVKAIDPAIAPGAIYTACRWAQKLRKEERDQIERLSLSKG